MGEWPVDLLVATEVKTFGGHSQRSSVIERDAVYSYQCRGQFEVQVGNQFQRLGPVRAHRVFSNQGTHGSLINQTIADEVISKLSV